MLSKGAWVVKAQWYESTSDDQQRRSYELSKDHQLVPVDVLVQEVGLEFQRAGLHQRVLTDASHVPHFVEFSTGTPRTHHEGQWAVGSWLLAAPSPRRSAFWIT